MIFSTEVRGIKCQIDITHIDPIIAPHYGSTPDWSEEGWGGELLWDLLDMQGNKLTSLWKQLTEAEIDQITDEAWEYLDAWVDDV